MIKKYFVMSDIHSFYDEMQKALKDAGFDINNKNHIFVSCGDLLDRGPKSRECLQFVNKLPKNRKILIRGNHEDLLEICVKNKFFESYDYHNGTVQTVNDLTQYEGPYTLEKDKDYIKYMNSLVDYAEIGEYVFVHGWVPVKMNGVSLTWDEARWLNGMEMWSQGYSLPDKTKTIVCGHWHTSYGHHKFDDNGSEFGEDADFSPFIKEGIIAIDACTAYSGFCNCVVLDI